jgi:inositol-phosphate phosphatase / L-galactose 1-phosphate phosphatase / histidinol-phosphatase
MMHRSRRRSRGDPGRRPTCCARLEGFALPESGEACPEASVVFNLSNMTDDLTTFLAFAETLADTARQILLLPENRIFKRDIKEDRSFVTSLDIEIERQLRQLIEIHYPEHGILGEEQDGVRLDADWVWILDPIDGTAPFIAGVPVYGSLVALARRGRPCLGVIDFPATCDRWTGAEGQPTRRNGEPCTTRKGLPMAAAMQCTMNPDFFKDEEKQIFEHFKAVTAWRIYGGSAFSYGRLASGALDLALDTNLKVHDYAAFVPIIEGAGGVITDWGGAPLTMNSGPRVLAAGDAALHAQALSMIAGGV